ncbi:MAG: hypothetical protein KAI81_07975 [Candidatus Marinimicrobia bacterium]|nr:hypothetical protein [Candidatus Neomarinimicrobiota bacterium]
MMKQNSSESLFAFDKKSQVEVLAQSGANFQIELIKSLDDSDSQELIAMSLLAAELKKNPPFTPATVRQLFNYPKTYPVIARLNGSPIACIIGVPLEYYNKESWVKCDKHWGDGTTIYTQVELVNPRFRNQNYIAVLSRMYLNFLGKRGFSYVSGHIKKGDSCSLSPNYQVIKEFDNWQNSYQCFDYYRIVLLK